MSYNNKASTGLKGFDAVIDHLRLGDNVVWQVQSIQDYKKVVDAYVDQALADGRRLVYMRFGRHEPLVDESRVATVYCLNADIGFEGFATETHNIIEREGKGVFYVFDCLTDLLEFWYSDLMIGNFFRLTCPFLYQLETIAYFAVYRRGHTYDTIARIRETTQVLFDLHYLEGEMYIHPLKVWERYAPAMFFPHLIRGDKAVSITASTEAARIFSLDDWEHEPRDYWDVMLSEARSALKLSEAAQYEVRDRLINLILGREARIRSLCRQYFSLKDLLDIAHREIGTGLIGGKSVGMLLARKILESEAWDVVGDHWSPHDSFYLGADIFYTYVVQNGWWDLRMKQKTADGYFMLAPELRKNLLTGRFPQSIRQRFMRMMEHFGQFPIIVRSSSLLEDNYGNAFAGKYDSVFCANQGGPDERYEAFEQAVREVYASTMNPDALAYRRNRGLMDRDEQMAILVQRVSGDHRGLWFFPHLAGVGNSSNLYVWEKGMDPDAGMLRLVFGLGTRAVDRTSGDYARLVALDDPAKSPPIAYGDEKKFSQHRVDLIHLRENSLTDVPMEEVAAVDLKADKSLFFTVDEESQRRMREMGSQPTGVPYILNFKKLLKETDFPALARGVLATLARAYDYPVDIEFTVNFQPDGSYVFRLLQCRPLQTRGLGAAVEVPNPDPEDILFKTSGNFMGGNTRLAFDYVVFVKVKEYLALGLRQQYAAARLVGELNQSLKGASVLLIGPGRWGTTTPSLGVPVHFTELSEMGAICEYSYQEGGVTPDLSFGSHFFQDVVESEIFYAAIFSDAPQNIFQPDMILARPNLTPSLAPKAGELAQVIQVVEFKGLTLYADVLTQELTCCRSNS